MAEFLLTQSQGFFDHLPDVVFSTGVFQVPNIFPVPSAVFGDDILTLLVSLGAHNPDITGFTDLCVHDRLSQALDRLLFDADVKDTDDLTLGIPDRLIGGDIPGVHHVGLPSECLPAHNRADHRIRRSIRIDVGYEGTDGPRAVELFHVCRDSENPLDARLFETLENGTGPSYKPLCIVNNGSIYREIAVLAEPFPANHHLGNLDLRALFGILINRVPFRELGI